MNTYTWTISALDCKINENNLQDVVYTVHWEYTAANETGITASAFGAQYVPPPSEEDFTPYDELTKEQVIGWIETYLNVPGISLYLDNQIELIINPVDTTPPLPFEN